MSLSERAALAWCHGLARSLPKQVIDRDGKPYLERYFAAGWSPTNRRSGPAVFLHRFVASDSFTTVHSHPWGWSASLILVGGYTEERCLPDGTKTTKQYKPGDVNIIEPDDRHRIDLLTQECWTLFLAGHFEKAWDFMPTCDGGVR